MTNPFYSSDETERSQAVLGEVVAAFPDAVLIGGWGTWVRTKGPMSHDIVSDRANLQLKAETLQALSETVDGCRVLTVPAGKNGKD